MFNMVYIEFENKRILTSNTVIINFVVKDSITICSREPVQDVTYLRILLFNIFTYTSSGTHRMPRTFMSAAGKSKFRCLKVIIMQNYMFRMDKLKITQCHASSKAITIVL